MHFPGLKRWDKRKVLGLPLPMYIYSLSLSLSLSLSISLSLFLLLWDFFARMDVEYTRRERIDIIMPLAYGRIYFVVQISKLEIFRQDWLFNLCFSYVFNRGIFEMVGSKFAKVTSMFFLTKKTKDAVCSWFGSVRFCSRQWVYIHVSVNLN